MKRLIFILFLGFLFTFLASCGKKDDNTITFNETEFTLESYEDDTGTSTYQSSDHEILLISENTVTYNGMEFTVKGDKYHFTVEYPGGSCSSFNQEPICTGQDDYPIKDIITLVLGINYDVSEGEESTFIAFVGIFMVLIGIFIFFKPYAAWAFTVGWTLKQGEPSEGYLIYLKICGIFVFLTGIGLLIYAYRM